MVLISAIYLPIMILIWKNRHKQDVYFKSPYMIITGGIGLYLDSMLNILLMSLGDRTKTRCYLSIMTTMTVHYLGYLSLIFRARRVVKVMMLERKYLDEIYEMADSGKSSVGGLSSLPSVLKARSAGPSGSSRELFIDPNDFTENLSQMGITQFELNLRLNKD